MSKILSLYINKNTSNFDKLIFLSFIINILFSFVLIYDFISSGAVESNHGYYLSPTYSNKGTEYSLEVIFDSGNNEIIDISKTIAETLNGKESVTVHTTPLLGYHKYLFIQNKKIPFDHSALIMINVFSLGLIVFYPFSLKILEDKKYPVVFNVPFDGKGTIADLGILYLVNIAFSIYAVYKVLHI